MCVCVCVCVRAFVCACIVLSTKFLVLEIASNWQISGKL